MIDLKKYNYITGQTIDVTFGISKIVDFFENSGKTPLFLHSKVSNFYHLIHTSSIEFENLSEFEKILKNRTNLFRVDLLVVDLWMVKDIGQVIAYKRELDKINIDCVILTNKYHYIKGDRNVNIYKIETEFAEKNNWKSDTKYLINDLIENVKITMDDLILSFKRNKKIDDIIDDNIC